MQNDDSVTKITWEQLLEEYFFSKNLRPDTEWSYCKVVRVFREFIGDILPGEVTVRDVQRYRRYVLKEQKRREVTWNNKVAHLRAIMGFGIKMKLLPQTENPLVEASVASTEKKKKTLSDNQMLRVYLVVQRFAEAEEQNMVNSRRRNAIYPAWYWLTVLDVLRYTGMRFNQLKHIRVRDVCPDESIIDLKLEGSKTHREWGVPLVAPLKVSMEKLLERARQCGAGDDDYLFDVCRFSEPISADRYQYCPIRAHQTVRSFFRRLSREVSAPPVTSCDGCPVWQQSRPSILMDTNDEFSDSKRYHRLSLLFARRITSKIRRAIICPGYRPAVRSQSFHHS